jgi:FAD synthetase
VSVISDSVDEIAAEVLRMSQKYDIVFTSGGIGPTHDDVTLRAVAKALNQEIRMNSEMVEHLHGLQACAASQGTARSEGQDGQSELDDTMLRFAMLPEHSRLRFPPEATETSEATSPTGASSSTDSLPRMASAPAAAIRSASHDGKTVRKTWPILQCDNIFVLPGVPQFFAAKMELIVKHFLSKSRRMHSRKIVLDLEERSLVKVLDALVGQHAGVKFGSYPFVDHPEFKTIITLESAERDRVERAVASLLTAVPSNAVLRVEKGIAARQV